MAILNTDEYQVVFSDTPGIIDTPHYKMQKAMNTFAYSALDDADVLMFIVDVNTEPIVPDDIVKKLKGITCPKLLILNKIDLSSQKEMEALSKWWTSELPGFEQVAISALEQIGVQELLNKIISYLPEGPPYYPKDQFTDRSERFFISEIVREKILEQFFQEIPYSCEVIVNSFKEDETRKDKLIRIAADIIVNRKTQKSIIIGKGGSSIKKLGTAARIDIEAFLERKVYLELYVKVKEKWRDDDRTLKSYGYLH